ncbi:TPA: hypothetical protein N2951_001218 [Vibrio parahaemolyticus]|nr:hypothetical protein [Vibrio parahaemolyticus]
MDEDIEENSQSLSIVKPALKQESEEIVGDYKIALNGEFLKTYRSRSVNLVAKNTSVRFKSLIAADFVAILKVRRSE